MKNQTYFTELTSPLGMLTIAATDEGLCGLYFEDHKHPPADKANWVNEDEPRFGEAREWLRRYFSGEKPGRTPKLMQGEGTDFQKRVWRALTKIAPGETLTYAQIADSIGSPNAVRAVGAAIGRNPLSIFVPCHRVVGSNGSLTGFAGGVERKRWLLTHEGATGVRVH